ncbi:MAG: hypothetical protein JWM53_5996 [bacterium]|nr:hypothetical protein [bacterium]
MAAVRRPVALPVIVDRPRTRAECIGGIRPCPWISCRHHLLVDVRADGKLTLNAESLEDLPQSCSLDIADSTELSLKAVGKLLGVTRERVRQLETRAIKKLRESSEIIELGERMPARRLPSSQRHHR